MSTLKTHLVSFSTPSSPDVSRRALKSCKSFPPKEFEKTHIDYYSQSTPVSPSVSRKHSRNSKHTSKNVQTLQTTQDQYQSKSTPTSPNLLRKPSRNQNVFISASSKHSNSKSTNTTKVDTQTKTPNLSHQTSRNSKSSNTPTPNTSNMPDVFLHRQSSFQTTLPLHNPNSMSLRSSRNQHADIPINTINSPRPSKNSATSSPITSTHTNSTFQSTKIASPEAPYPNMYLHATSYTDPHLTSKLIRHIRDSNDPAMIKLLGSISLDQMNHGHIIGDTALHEACMADNPTAVTALLAVPGIQLNTRDNFGYSPVMLAAYCCSTRALAVLLQDQGVDMDILNWREESLEQIVEGRQAKQKLLKQDTIDLIRMERITREILRRHASVDIREHLSRGNINQTTGHIGHTNKTMSKPKQTVGYTNQAVQNWERVVQTVEQNYYG